MNRHPKPNIIKHNEQCELKAIKANLKDLKANGAVLHTRLYGIKQITKDRIYFSNGEVYERRHE